MMIKLNDLFTLSLTVLNLMLGASRAAVITTANHGLACPGEELVYVCVSQGTSQRWRWLIVGSQIKEHIYSRTAAVGTQEQLIDENQNVYNLMLNSTDYNAFTSTISAIATLSMHNIRLECTGQFPTSVVIQIAGVPMSPINVQSAVDEYQDYSSAVLLAWDVPDDNSRVDYYQYQVVNATESGIVTYNTSNTSVIISGVPYNKNVTFSVLAANCVGESATVLETVNIVGCSKIDDSPFNVLSNASKFSQTPGTEISILCIYSTSEGDETIHSICQDNGRWEPDPNSVLYLCVEDPTNATIKTLEFVTTINYSTPSVMETSDASLMPIMHYVYIFIALITIGLLILAGVTICCIFKLTLHRNKGESINVDHEYYEVIDPIYEAVSIAVKGSNQPGTQIEMKNNDAYKSKTASHASVGINIENNEAYIHITPEIDALQTEHNMSYVYQLQGPPFDLNNAVILEGHTSMQERYENKSVCNSDNIQQVVSGQGNTSTSQNVEQVPLCIESVDLNNNTASYRSSELTIEPQLQGVCLSELSWEKQSIDSNDVESHTDEAVQ